MSKSKHVPKWFTEFVPQEVSDSTLFKFKVTIGDKKIEVDMRADLGIDYTAIQQQLEDTPSEYSYWAAIYSELKAQSGQLERKVKARRGKIAHILLEEATKNNIKLTDKQLATAIEGDNELNKLEDWLLLMNKHTGKMFFMVQAIQMKAEALRSLAGFAKIEYQQAKN